MLLAPLDSLESAELIYWVYVGTMTSVVCMQQSAAISPTSGWGIVTKLSGYISGMVQLMPDPFFGRKIFGVKGHGPKRGKTVKIYLLLQFLSQDVHLFRMCCPPQGRKNVGNGILIQGPKILQKFFENGQNFELFCYLSQKLKNLGLDRFWGPDFISVEKFWFGAPVWPARAPERSEF